MKISRSTRLPAGVEEAFAIIATEDYQQTKAAAQATASSATVNARPDGLVIISTERTLATAGMPSVVTSVVGENLVISEVQTWRPATAQGNRVSDVEITVDGVPVRMLGTVTLSPAGEGSTLAVDADLTCSVPFLGKKIEQSAKPTVEASFDMEAQLLTQRLS